MARPSHVILPVWVNITLMTLARIKKLMYVSSLHGVSSAAINNFLLAHLYMIKTMLNILYFSTGISLSKTFAHTPAVQLTVS